MRCDPLEAIVWESCACGKRRARLGIMDRWGLAELAHRLPLSPRWDSQQPTWPHGGAHAQFEATATLLASIGLWGRKAIRDMVAVRG